MNGRDPDGLMGGDCYAYTDGDDRACDISGVTVEGEDPNPAPPDPEQFLNIVGGDALAVGGEPSGTGAASQPQRLGQRGPSCLPQLGYALLSTALDLTLFLGPEFKLIFTGAGELAVGGVIRGSAVIGRAGGGISKAVAARAIAGAIDLVANGRAAMALGTAQLPSALVTGAELDLGSQALNPELANASWRDFVPVVGSVRAWKAWGACRGGGG